jgi:hypothetical protein
MKESVEVLTARRGNILDALVTIQDLVDLGLARMVGGVLFPAAAFESTAFYEPAFA